jgi:hypothetical protein
MGMELGLGFERFYARIVTIVAPSTIDHRIEKEYDSFSRQ